MIVLYITVGIVFVLITCMNFYAFRVIKSLGYDYNSLGTLSKEVKNELNTALENLDEIILKGNRKNLDLTDSVYSFLKKARLKAEQLGNISKLKLDSNITKFEKYAQEAYSEKTPARKKEIFELCSREVYYACERLAASDEELSALIHNETNFISSIFAVLLAGNILAFVGIFVVIFFNDRKIRQKEESLNSTNANFHAIMQGLDSILFSFDSVGTVQTWNDNAARYFDLKSGDAIGKNIYALLPLLQPFKAFFDKALYSQQRQYSFHERMHINKGPSRIVDILCVPLVSSSTADKEQKALLVKIEDVTSFVTEEEHSVHVRSAQLIGSGMENVVKESSGLHAQAVEILQTLDEIAAMHAISTDTAPYTAYLNNILAELSGIPQKYASTLQMGQLNKIPLDLNALVMYVLRICLKTFDPCINIEVSQNEAKSWIMADPAALSRALFCLLNNAAEAMTEMKYENEAQGGIISVSVEKIEGEKIVCDKIMRFRRAAKEPPYWVVMISDNGVGISGSILPSIFDMFFTTKDTAVHKGLGLSVVVNIINALDGFIDVNSKPGNGSVFKIYLPEATDMPADAGAFDVVPADSEEDIVAGQGTVLFACDDIFMRQMTAKLMEKFGYAVISSDNGFEALDLYAQDINSGERNIQCVVSNLTSGVIRNVEFASNLRQMDPGVSLIVMINSEKDEEVNSLQELGVTGFIKKPYSMHELSQVLVQYSHSMQEQA